jgi:hypothetical protein
MDNFESSTPWRVSAFQRARRSGQHGLAEVDRATLLPTTLLGDLRRLQGEADGGDVLEVVAACLRHHESALLYLGCEDYVWPVTLFPREFLYHSPRDFGHLRSGAGMAKLSLLSVDPPGVRPPGHVMHERISALKRYRPMQELVWDLSLHGPRPSLLTEIAGRVAYKVVASGVRELPSSLGALRSAVARLQQEAASLPEIAHWPGLSPARASRLLNGLYLTGVLMLSRSHPAATRQGFGLRALFRRGH